ncbi:MAG: NADH-quinone oxidoreductase subunit, partial [Thermoleophilaceae bacterium]|nr:NADH-quinone oxidoreductase subunit [Thermoleophilaceae bacterium]
GAFSTKLAFGLVASVGVALAAVYMIRLYQRSMHNRTGPDVKSFDLGRWELLTIAPLVAVIVALGVYPNFIVERTERATLAHERQAADAGITGAYVNRATGPPLKP